MGDTWIPNGPVSLPPRWLAYSAGAIVVALAVLGAGMGVRAAFRDGGAPDLGGPAGGAADKSTLVAGPIVQAPPPVAAPDASADADKDDAADADQQKADALAAKAAMAQEIQAKPSKPGGDIDDILASPSEKPPAAVKPTADETPPPGAPVKTDVPF
jgi:hypothetical protein